MKVDKYFSSTVILAESGKYLKIPNLEENLKPIIIVLDNSSTVPEIQEEDIIKL